MTLAELIARDAAGVAIAPGQHVRVVQPSLVLAGREIRFEGQVQDVYLGNRHGERAVLVEVRPTREGHAHTVLPEHVTVLGEQPARRGARTRRAGTTRKKRERTR